MVVRFLFVGRRFAPTESAIKHMQLVSQVSAIGSSMFYLSTQEKLTQRSDAHREQYEVGQNEKVMKDRYVECPCVLLEAVLINIIK